MLEKKQLHKSFLKKRLQKFGDIESFLLLLIIITTEGAEAAVQPLSKVLGVVVQGSVEYFLLLRGRQFTAIDPPVEKRCFT